MTQGLASFRAQLRAFDQDLARLTNQKLALQVDDTQAVRELDVLNARVGAVRKAAETPIAVVVTAPPPPLPAPVVVPPSDFSQFIAEAKRAADIAHDEFVTALQGAFAQLGNEAFQASVAAGQQLRAGFLAEVEGISQQVAAGLISPTDAKAAIDRALAVVSEEIIAKQRTIPPVEIRTLVLPAAAAGVTTGLSPGVIPTEELDAAERSFEKLSGVAEATSQTFVKVGSSSSLMRVGVRQAATSLSVLAAQALGTNSAVGRLAESTLFLGTGFADAEGKISGALGKVAAGAAVVLVLAKAYEFLHTAEAEAQKAQDDLVAGLVQEASLMSASEKAARGLAAALEAQADARSKTFRNTALTAVASIASPSFGQAVGQELGRRQQEELANATKAATQAQRDQEQAVRDFQDLNVKTLTQAISLHAADNFQIKQARGFLAVLAQQEIAASTPVARRLELRQQELDLLAAINDAATVSSGNDQIAALGRELAVLQVGERAVRRLELAQAAGTDEQRRAILAIFDQVTALQALKGAHASAAAAIVTLEDAVAALDAALGQTHTFHLDTGEADKKLTDLLVKLQQGQKDKQTKELGNIPLPENTIPAGFDRAQASVEGLNDSLTAAAAKSNAFFKSAVLGAAGLNDKLHAVTRAVDGIVGVARGIGLIGDEAGQSIGSVLNLVDSLGSLKEANAALENAKTGAETAAASLAKLGAVAGIIGAGVSIIGSFLAPSAADRERNRLVQQNNDRLADLTAALDKSFAGIGGQAEAQAAVHELVTRKIPGVGGGVEGATLGLEFTGHFKDGQKFFEDEVKKAGLSLEQLKALAKEAGITLFDSSGVLIKGSLAALDEKLRLAAEAAQGFTETFDSQTQLLELRNRIQGGPQDAATKFQQDLAAAGKLGATAITDVFKDVKPGDTDAARAALLKLLDAFQNQQIDPKTLGKLEREDFLRLLNDGADSLDVFKKAVDEATHSTLNLPEGFRLKALAFAASDRGPVPLPPPAIPPELLPPLLHPNIDPGALGKTPDDLLRAVDGVTVSIDDLAQALGIRTTASQQPASGSSTFPSPTVQTGPTLAKLADAINITISGVDKDADQFASEILDKLREKALRQSGDSLQFGSLT